MHSLRMTRPPLALASERRGRTLSAVKPPPRFEPVYTLLKYWFSMPSVANTTPGREERVSSRLTDPSGPDESTGVVEESLGSAGVAGVVSAVAVGSPGRGASVGGPAGSPLPPQAVRKSNKPAAMARQRTY